MARRHKNGGYLTFEVPVNFINEFSEADWLTKKRPELTDIVFIGHFTVRKCPVEN
jgi:hypothetical protein